MRRIGDRWQDEVGGGGQRSCIMTPEYSILSGGWLKQDAKFSTMICIMIVHGEVVQRVCGFSVNMLMEWNAQQQLMMAKVSP